MCAPELFEAAVNKTKQLTFASIIAIVLRTNFVQSIFRGNDTPWLNHDI